MTTATLTTPALQVPAKGAHLGFGLFLDTEETDPVTVERSTDGGSTWAGVPFTARDRGETATSDGFVSGSGDRRWVQARADLTAGEQVLRWRYTTDGAYLGRGVHVDDVRVARGGHVLLDGETSPGDFVAEGWTLTSR